MEALPSWYLSSSARVPPGGSSGPPRESLVSEKSSAFFLRALDTLHKYSTIDILIPYHMVRIGYGFIHFNMRKISILQVTLRSQY